MNHKDVILYTNKVSKNKITLQGPPGIYLNYNSVYSLFKLLPSSAWTIRGTSSMFSLPFWPIPPPAARVSTDFELGDKFCLGQICSSGAWGIRNWQPASPGSAAQTVCACPEQCWKWLYGGAPPISLVCCQTLPHARYRHAHPFTGLFTHVAPEVRKAHFPEDWKFTSTWTPKMWPYLGNRIFADVTS